MRPSIREALLAALFFLPLIYARPTAAQETPADLTSPGALIEREVGPREPVRVMLSRRLIYAAVVNLPDVDLVVRSTGGRPQRGLAARKPGPAGTSHFEVYAGAEGEHVVEVVGFDSRRRVRLRLEVDSASSALRAARDSQPRFSAGVEAAFGGHGGYAPFGELGPSGGAGVMDLCLSVRYGFRVGGCLGYSREEVSGMTEAFDFFFGELRVTVLGHPDRGPVTAGVSARVGQGNLSGAAETVDPSVVSAGVWAAWWPVHRSSGRGLSLRGSLALAHYGNLRGSRIEYSEPLPGEDPIPHIVRFEDSDTALRFLLGLNWHP